MKHGSFEDEGSDGMPVMDVRHEGKDSGRREYLGPLFTHAIVTIPVLFNDMQRAKEAGTTTVFRSSVPSTNPLLPLSLTALKRPTVSKVL